MFQSELVSVGEQFHRQRVGMQFPMSSIGGFASGRVSQRQLDELAKSRAKSSQQTARKSDAAIDEAIDRALYR